MQDDRRNTLKAIILGGITAGSVDIFSPALIYLVSPVLICKAIASGLLGKPAFSGGWGVVVLGLLLQWAMSIIIAAIFVTAWKRLAWMRRDWRLTGLLYGVPVYLVMTYVVRPLSAAWPPADYSKPIDWIKVGENLLAMLLFGLILAWFARRFLTRRPA
ncbi:MAG TPA: hypothetical protein VLV87_07890 [Gammaproteobacteria bacterium]|nr:hypothetical protein [Gammaproteobacteria bacterium]